MRDHSAARSRRPGASLVTLASLVLVLAACSSTGTTSQAPGSEAPASQAPSSQAPSGTTVTMSGSAFSVDEITVPVGVVTFVNEDGVLHIVAEGENGSEASDPRITKATIDGGGRADIAFDAPGDYHITCLIHGSMNMEVHVQ